MHHALIMRSAAVLSMVYGLAFLFAPNGLLALYKAQLMNSPGIYNAMLLGAYLVGIAAMNWTASKGTIEEARHVILGTLVAMAIGFVVALYRQLTDAQVTQAAWLNVAIFLVFTILFGYLQFAALAPRASRAQPAV